MPTIQHPDKTTGLPSTSSAAQETFAYNALDQGRTVDRNNTVHSFLFDVLGRPTTDKLSNLGGGVDGAVQRLETAYDTGGRPYLFTSYSTPGGGTVVNQVQDAFNGLGQLTAEYQDHGGAVNTQTTPQVQYAYSELAAGANNSRLLKTVYPNGRVLWTGYSAGSGAAGLDDRISRVSFLADDNSGAVGTHLEELSYLGLGTAVQRARPQDGANLTYLASDGPGDGGDLIPGRSAGPIGRGGSPAPPFSRSAFSAVVT